MGLVYFLVDKIYLNMIRHSEPEFGTIQFASIQSEHIFDRRTSVQCFCWILLWVALHLKYALVGKQYVDFGFGLKKLTGELFFLRKYVRNGSNRNETIRITPSSVLIMIIYMHIVFAKYKREIVKFSSF